MKRILLFALLSVTVFSLSAQMSLTPISIGLHGDIFNADTKQSPYNGYGMSVSFNRIYIDFASNMVSGKGEYLEFSSSQTYSANKVHISVFNFGYLVPVKKFLLIPHIGIGMTNEIFQDPVGWNTYFQRSLESKINLGLIASVKLSNHIRIQAGVGSFETFKFGLSYYSDYGFFGEE